MSDRDMPPAPDSESYRPSRSSDLTLAQALANPRWARIISWVVVVQLTALAFVLRQVLEIGLALDVDALNLGAGAFRFSVLDQQPHPPGYPGYVLFLKALHVLVPQAGPLDLALWGSQLCSAATVPAAWWACQGILQAGRTGAGGTGAGGTGRDNSVGRPLAAALLAVFHPLLWYYGSDGQNHAMEALLTLILFGSAARIACRYSLGRMLLFVAVLGGSGALRPTLPIVLLPLPFWLLLRRPAAHWLAAGAVGITAVGLWYLPLTWVSGGWDLYHRSNRALLTEMFFSNYSVFGRRVTPNRFLMNLNLALYGCAYALIPYLAVNFGRDRSREPWRKAVLAVGGLSLAFYVLFYTAEAGYYSSVAALGCLVPATWNAAPGRSVQLRTTAALLGGIGFFLFAPGTFPRIGVQGTVAIPNLSFAAGIQRDWDTYTGIVCPAVGDQPSFVISDHPGAFRYRQLPWTCGRILAGVYLHRNYLMPELDNWLIFDRLELDTLPTEVPFEVGPPAVGTLRFPVSQVVVAPDATVRFMEAVAQQASCGPLAGGPGNPPPTWPEGALVYPSRCLPELKLGAHRVIIPSPQP